MAEPWLRGTLTQFDAVKRQVLHALELAGEDVEQWCAGLSQVKMEAQPFGLASVGFHLRHIARSLDRLLTYAEGGSLSERQLSELGSEPAVAAEAELTVAGFRESLAEAVVRVVAISPKSYEEPRRVGRKGLPSTVGGLLVHCAEHTQRHVGQAITTAKVVAGMREAG